VTLTFIFSHAHEELEHFAMYYTHHLLQRQYWWPRMHTHVQQFLGEFQILCEEDLIDYQTTSHDHMKMHRLGKKVVQMVKWGSQKKGRLKYWNLQLPWLAMGYQFKQTSLPSFSLFFLRGHNVELPTTIR